MIEYECKVLVDCWSLAEGHVRTLGTNLSRRCSVYPTYHMGFLGKERTLLHCEPIDWSQKLWQDTRVCQRQYVCLSSADDNIRTRDTNQSVWKTSLCNLTTFFEHLCFQLVYIMFAHFRSSKDRQAQWKLSLVNWR